jgi:sugar phosphate isomerase/epimerase
MEEMKRAVVYMCGSPTDISPADLERVVEAVGEWGFEGVEAFVDILPCHFSMFPRVMDMLQKGIADTIWTLRVELLGLAPVDSLLHDVIQPARAAGAHLFTVEEGEVRWEEVEDRFCSVDEPIIVECS